MKFAVIFWFLTVLAGALPAGTVSDVKIHAGYLILVGNDKTELYDLAVVPMAKVSEIVYPESSIPINMEIEDQRLFIYHYLDDYDNGIYIYDITSLIAPILIKDFLVDGLIQGGFVAHGQFHLAQGGRFYINEDRIFFLFSNRDTKYGQYYHYLHRYDISNDVQVAFQDDRRDFDSEECWPMYNSYYLDVFMADNGRNIWLKNSYQGNLWFADLEDFLDGDSACFADAAWDGANVGMKGGPMRFIDEFSVLRGFGVFTGWANYSGFKVVDPNCFRGCLYFLSDFACPWSEKHGGRDSGITYDNSIYDVQDILVKNGDIFLTSYFTKSVPYTYFYQDWNGYMACQPEKWNFYDLEAPPYGMAAANGVLYVAAADGLHEFPLIHPDEKLPEARITEMRQEGNLLTVRGKARDDEGIRTVWVRLGHAHVSKAGTPTAECRHCPPLSLWDEWEWSLETSGIAPGEYEIKVITEDKDGDFTAISAGAVRIGYGAKDSKGFAAMKEVPSPIAPR